LKAFFYYYNSPCTKDHLPKLLTTCIFFTCSHNIEKTFPFLSVILGMEFKQVATYDNYMLANMAMGLMTEHEIKCQLKDENIITMDPLLNAAVGGIKLLVEAKDYDRALLLMTEAENEYLKEIPCPVCKSLSLVVEEKTNNPAGFWGRVKNQALYGQTATYSKGYRCTNCNKYFSELPPSF